MQTLALYNLCGVCPERQFYSVNRVVVQSEAIGPAVSILPVDLISYILHDFSLESLAPGM